MHHTTVCAALALGVQLRTATKTMANRRVCNCRHYLPRTPLFYSSPRIDARYVVRVVSLHRPCSMSSVLLLSSTYCLNLYEGSERWVCHRDGSVCSRYAFPQNVRYCCRAKYVPRPRSLVPATSVLRKHKMHSSPCKGPSFILHLSHTSYRQYITRVGMRLVRVIS